MDVTPRDPMPPDALTLPARYYTDASLFAAELDRFYRRMWVCVGRTDDIPEPGRYVLRDVAGESLILVRHAPDGISAFHNLCRHRGTRLCTEADGRFADQIQCPYHAWTYDLQGRLVGAPHMEDVPHFDKAAYPLHSLPVGCWDGHVFLTLASDPVPLDRQLAGLPDKFRPWRMGELRRGARTIYDVKANWKLIVQNYSECLHCPVIHPVLNRLSHYLTGDNEPLQPTYMGGRMELRDGVDTMTGDGVRRRACLPGLEPDDRRRVYYYSVFPNLLLSLHPDYMLTHTLWPLAADRTRIICEWHFHPDEMAKADFDPADAVDFWDMTNRQDWQVSEQAQQGISSPAYRPGPYSNREDLLYAFDRFIVQGHASDAE